MKYQNNCNKCGYAWNTTGDKPKRCRECLELLEIDVPAITIGEYQKKSERTMPFNHPILDSKQLAAIAFCTGLCGESGEVADLLKKHLFHGHPLDKEKLTKELGDVLWYISALASSFGIALDDVMIANVAKLEARYPNGFNSADSIERRDRG